MAELEIKNLNKYYHLGNKTDFHALTDINLTFEKGELVSVVGESGSGKSTLMNVIGGLDSDFTGEIVVGGEDIKKLTDKELDEYRKKKVGFVFQSFNLIPHLTILDNVTIALTLSNVNESEKVQRATEILKRLGLENQIKKKPTQLSGGQKQRVAIARALINDPEIILADEPTGALDSDTTWQILEILKGIADEGKLVIMVTHSEKVASVSSRVVELTDGRITKDSKKRGYKKGEIAQKLTTEQDKTVKNKKKTNLSFWSALKLSFHNMWASKVKNLLIAFGVSISLVSLILMLAFGSGLTDYIKKLSDQYANPNFVTITKRGTSTAMGSGGGMSMFNAPAFGEEDENEITDLIDKINDELKTGGYDYRVTEKDITYGFNKMTIGSATYNFKASKDDNGNYKYDESSSENSEEKLIYYVYTTPPYYGQNNMLSGYLSGNNPDGSNPSGLNEVMFSKALIKTLGFESAEEIAGNVKLNINLNFTQSNFKFQLNTAEIGENDLGLSNDVVVTGIIDISAMLENFPVMYVSYDYLTTLVEYTNLTKQQQIKLFPTAIYINTGSENITNFINSWLDKQGKYSGSVEEQMANMFTSMISTFSTALAIIAGISLVVAAIMILVVLYMSVTERTREIGVLKSIGARRKDIKRIFSSESFLIGVLSGMMGILLSLIIYIVFHIVLTALLGAAPLSLRWWYFALALGISIVISMLSGLMPAAKAAKLDPVESLRHE